MPAAPQKQWQQRRTAASANAARHAHPLLDTQCDPIQNDPIPAVMVSYGSRSGTAGPHVDSYDVLLVAGAGAREWRVAYEAVAEGAEVEIPHCPLRVLAGPGGGVFTEPRRSRWVSYAVRPGDVVYVPRRHPHWGVSVSGEGGMTYSVGLRSPAAADVARAYVADVADRLCGRRGVADPVAAMAAALTPGWAAGGAAGAAATAAAVAAAEWEKPDSRRGSAQRDLDGVRKGAKANASGSDRVWRPRRTAAGCR